MSGRFTSGWYLLYTRPKHERKVIEKLNDLKVPFLFPTTRVLHRWCDRTKSLSIPLFPSYIFVYLMDTGTYFAALNTNGVLYYVRTGSGVCRVSDQVVNSIRLLVGSGEELEVSDRTFQRGDKSMIGEGPRAGLECEIIEDNGKRMCLVRVSILRRNILLRINTDRLIKETVQMKKKEFITI